MTQIKKIIQRFIQNSFVTKRFFVVWSLAIVFFILSFGLEFLFPLGKLILIVLFAFTVVDFVLVQLFENKIDCNRITPHVLPLGDE